MVIATKVYLSCQINFRKSKYIRTHKYNFVSALQYIFFCSFLTFFITICCTLLERKAYKLTSERALSCKSCWRNLGSYRFDRLKQVQYLANVTIILLQKIGQPSIFIGESHVFHGFNGNSNLGFEVGIIRFLFRFRFLSFFLGLFGFWFFQAWVQSSRGSLCRFLRFCRRCRWSFLLLWSGGLVQKCPIIILVGGNIFSFMNSDHVALEEVFGWKGCLADVARNGIFLLDLDFSNFTFLAFLWLFSRCPHLVDLFVQVVGRFFLFVIFLLFLLFCSKNS